MLANLEDSNVQIVSFGSLLINVLALASPIIAIVLTLVQQLGQELSDYINDPSHYVFGYNIKISYSIFSALPLLLPAVF